MPLTPAYAKEKLRWTQEEQESVQGVIPTAKYGKLSEALRHSVSEAQACKLGCRGKNCKYESDTHWTDDQMAIQGCFSHWVTDNILATARPNTDNMKKHNLIEQYKQHGIKSIINLQQSGEHCSCGNPLEPSGFSYMPQEFMDNDIFYYNFGWQDYGVGSLGNILDMVKVTQFALSEGKIAVHCHAGLGRTGVLMACYLVYNNRMESSEVINYIRMRRPGAVQTGHQVQFIQEFAQYMLPLRVIFSTGEPGTYNFTLNQYLIRQRNVLHGLEGEQLKHIPKVIYVCCERLLQLAGHSTKRRHWRDTYDIMLKTAPSAFNNVPAIKSSSERPHLHESHSSPALTQNSLRSSKLKSVSIESFTARDPFGKLSRSKGKNPGLNHSTSSNSEMYSDSDSVTGTPYGSELDLRKRAASDPSQTEHHAENVATALAVTVYTEETKKIVNKYKRRLNEDDVTWVELQKEMDAVVLAALMLDWMDHLKEPILHTQDLPGMLEYTDSPTEGLDLIGKGPKHTVLYLFETISHLCVAKDSLEVDVIQRLLSTLTHQNMVLEDPVLTNARSIIKRTSNDTGLMRDNVANKLMFFFMGLLHRMRESHIPRGGRDSRSTHDPSQNSKRSSYESDKSSSDSSTSGRLCVNGTGGENRNRKTGMQEDSTKMSGQEKVRSTRSSASKRLPPSVREEGITDSHSDGDGDV